MSDHLPGNFFRLHGKRSKGDRIEPKRILLRRVESLPGPITPWSCRPKPWAFRTFPQRPQISSELSTRARRTASVWLTPAKKFWCRVKQNLPFWSISPMSQLLSFQPSGFIAASMKCVAFLYAPYVFVRLGQRRRLIAKQNPDGGQR